MDEATGTDTDQGKRLRRSQNISAETVPQQHFHTVADSEIVSGIQSDNNEFSNLDSDSAFDVGFVTERTFSTPSPKSISNNSECRRSARKKVIKFDVRDLLNKNRKSHKIQIEARIDSNSLMPSVSNAESTILNLINESNNQFANTTGTATATNTNSFQQPLISSRRFTMSDAAFSSFAGNNAIALEHQTSETQGIVHDLPTNVRRQKLSPLCTMISTLDDLPKSSTVTSKSKNTALFGISGVPPPKKRGRPRKIKTDEVDTEMQLKVTQEGDSVKKMSPEDIVACSAPINEVESDLEGDSKTCKNFIVALKRVLLPNTTVVRASSSNTQLLTAKKSSGSTGKIEIRDEESGTLTVQPSIVYNEQQREFDLPITKDVNDTKTPTNTLVLTSIKTKTGNAQQNCTTTLPELNKSDTSVLLINPTVYSPKSAKEDSTYSSVCAKLFVKSKSVRSSSMPPNEVKCESKKQSMNFDSSQFKQKRSKSVEILPTLQFHKKSPSSLEKDLSASNYQTHCGLPVEAIIKERRKQTKDQNQLLMSTQNNIAAVNSTISTTNHIKSQIVIEKRHSENLTANIKNSRCPSHSVLNNSPSEHISKRRQTICESIRKNMMPFNATKQVQQVQNKRRSSVDVTQPTTTTIKTHSHLHKYSLSKQSNELNAEQCVTEDNTLDNVRSASQLFGSNVSSSAISSSEQCQSGKKVTFKRHRKLKDVAHDTNLKSVVNTAKAELANSLDTVECPQISKDNNTTKELKIEGVTNITKANKLDSSPGLAKKELMECNANQLKSASDTEISSAEQSDHPKHLQKKFRRNTICTRLEISNDSLGASSKHSELTYNKKCIKTDTMPKQRRSVDHVSLNKLESQMTGSVESVEGLILPAHGCEVIVPHKHKQKEKKLKEHIENKLSVNDNTEKSMLFVEEFKDKLEEGSSTLYCNSSKELVSEKLGFLKPQTAKLKSDLSKVTYSHKAVEESNSSVCTLKESVLNKNSQKVEPAEAKADGMKTVLPLPQLHSANVNTNDRNSCSSNGNKVSVSSHAEKATALALQKSSNKRIRKRNNKESNAVLEGAVASEPKTHPKSSYSPLTSLDSSAASQPTSMSIRSNVLTEDEAPDPLKDIEKFIEAGVNLLKRDYKMDDDSIDNEVTQSTLSKMSLSDEFAERVRNLETPADSPEPQPLTVDCLPLAPLPVRASLLTPSPKDIYESGVRRSHRIKQKPPKALVGRGVVRDGECTVSYSIDQQLIELAQIELINEKFLKSERLNTFHMIRENIYKCNRMVSKETVDMQCECFLTTEEVGNGQWGCGEGCINRMLMIECGSQCSNRERCTNTRFQKQVCSPCRVFRTEKKGCGIVAEVQILPGDFVMEYVGEVIDNEEFERRQHVYSKDKNRHYYFMALRPDAIIDATVKGNISRFINHSCDPNAETQKWTVNGELRIGFFSRKTIIPGEEITFDYQYQRYGRDAQPCFCEAENCRGWIGEKPSSEEDDDIYLSDGEHIESSGAEEDSTADLESSGDDEMNASGRKMKEIKTAKARKNSSTSSIGDDDISKTKIHKMPAKARAKKLKEGHHKTPQQQKPDKERVRDRCENKGYKWNRMLAKGAQATNQAENKQRVMRFLEDPDVEQEVNILSRSGLKNQTNTLRLSRLMVRAKLVPTRLRLLGILRHGEIPCRRLFLDYHGLRLLHGWMSDNGSEINLRCALLEALDSLPIHNKTMLTDSKIYQTVKSWTTATVKSNREISTVNSDVIEESGCKDEEVAKEVQAKELVDVEIVNMQKKAETLTAKWDSLPEIFRIPKRERIEQMKEHEREANRQSDSLGGGILTNDLTTTPLETVDRYKRDRFGRVTSSRYLKPSVVINNGGSMSLTPGGGNLKETRHTASGTFNPSSSGGYKCDSRRRTDGTVPGHQYDNRNKYLPKELHREMFERKVARYEAEKRMAEERRVFEIKCHYFGLDPLSYDPQYMPSSENIETGEFFDVDGHLVPPPPRCGEMQPAPPMQTCDPAHYELPEATKNLPSSWIFAITPDGYIYYMDLSKSIAQWEPPTVEQIKSAETTESESSDTGTGSQSDESVCGSDVCMVDIDSDYAYSLGPEQLNQYIREKVKERRRKRYERLVSVREISPRRDEDRMFNQLEARKYKENKEKIRRRKEVFRRKRSEISLLPLPPVSTTTTKVGNAATEIFSYTSLPIQDYLYSSDESSDMDEYNHSPSMDAIVQGDKMVDELDTINNRRHLKRQLPLPPLSLEPSTSKAATSKLRTLPLPPMCLDSKQESTLSSNSSMEFVSNKTSNVVLQERSAVVEHKRRRIERAEKRRSHISSSVKEKFRSDVARIIVEYLKPYRKESCQRGRITNDCDFYHLARRLTHYIMTKELKYCESIGQMLVVNDSVKHKTRDYIKLYMQKYGKIYKRPENAPEFKEIRLPTNT